MRYKIRGNFIIIKFFSFYRFLYIVAVKRKNMDKGSMFKENVQKCYFTQNPVKYSLFA